MSGQRPRWQMCCWARQPQPKYNAGDHATLTGERGSTAENSLDIKDPLSQNSPPIRPRHFINSSEVNPWPSKVRCLFTSR
jgi:hypothetical protein